MLLPKNHNWAVMCVALDGFSDDFLEERIQPVLQERSFEHSQHPRIQPCDWVGRGRLVSSGSLWLISSDAFCWDLNGIVRLCNHIFAFYRLKIDFLLLTIAQEQDTIHRAKFSGATSGLDGLEQG